MAARYSCHLLTILSLAVVVAAQASPSSSISASTSLSHDTFATSSRRISSTQTTDFSVSYSSTVLNGTLTSTFSFTGSKPISSDTVIASSGSSSPAVMSNGNSTFSASGTESISNSVQTTSAVTSSMFGQSQASTATTSLGKLDLYHLSSNASTAATATTKAMSDGSATTLTSSKSSSPLHLPINVTSLTTSREAFIVSSTSTPPAKLTSATTHLNSTSLVSNPSGSALSSIAPSSAPISLVSSSPSRTSITTSNSNHSSTATSTTAFTITSSGTDTLTAMPLIAIPTTSLSPNNAAAIAGGVAIGEGLAFLCATAIVITSEAGLLAAQAEFLASIGMLKSNLERLSLDLGGGGGGGTSCSGSKSRFRHKNRSILSGLLDTITRIDCSLSTTEMHLNQVHPDLDLIENDWVVLGGLASELANEEEEEEEEEKKESQSAEEEKASETASSNAETSASTKRTSSTHTSTTASSASSSIGSSRSSSTVSSRFSSTVSSRSSSTVSSVSSTTASSVPPSFLAGSSEGDPSDYPDNEAADDAIFAAAAAAIQAGMGGSNNTTAATSDLYTSMTARTVPSIYTTSTSSISVAVPDKGRPGIKSSGTTQSSNFVDTATSEIGPRSASVSETSLLLEFSLSASTSSTPRYSATSTFSVASVASVFGTSSISAASEASAASVLRASSISAVSAASIASVLRASAVSASAASFPSQITSNHGGSSLCKSLGGNSTCVNAYQSYNPQYKYTRYTSYAETLDNAKGAWLGWGCAAMLKCDNDEAYATGMMGQQIINAFTYLYADDGVGVCGSIYMDNGCHLTIDACDTCESNIPCNALPAQYQPPKGGVRCYYEDGTTWPPTPDPEPKGGPRIDKRFVS